MTQKSESKTTYEKPCMEVCDFETEDIITFSTADEDENQGEWDPLPSGWENF